MVGFVLVLLIPIFILYMVNKARKELHVTNRFNESKVGLAKMSPEDFSTAVNAGCDKFAYTRGNAIFFQMLGMSIMAIIMMMFFTLDQSINFSLTWAVFLVFGMRFAVGYARELGNVAGKILSNRKICGPLFGLSLKEIRANVSK
jgi:glucose uptake protein GlcU